jgi:D-glycero-beta-D-manno-heptose-7-phosphate kinase
VTSRARLHGIVEGFTGRRIVVFGDLVLDRFVLGTPKRISREAPVIILRFEEQRDVPGGAANAIANVASLGGSALPVGVVGDDEQGASLLAELRAHDIDVSGVGVVPGLRTVTKVRLLAGGPSSLKFQVARYDIEANLPAEAPGHQALTAALASLAPGADAVAVSDYGYGAVTGSAVARLRGHLRGGVPVVADSRYALATLAAVDGVTPNLEELESAAGRVLRTDAQVADAAEALRRRLQARFVLATRGSHGMTLVEENEPARHIPVYGTDQVADVTGAGDTVLATLTLALASGATAAEAATLADIAGGIVVMKLGTATVSREELHRGIDLAAFLHD